MMNLEQKLPEKLFGYCNICEKEMIFKYVFTQPNFIGGEDIPLYNCSSCGGTKAYQTLIKKFNARPIESQQ